MTTLTTNQFNNYLETLNIYNECGFTYASDEVGNVCSISTSNNIKVEDIACIDGYEHLLTEYQKQALINHTSRFIENQEASKEMTHFEFYTNIYN